MDLYITLHLSLALFLVAFVMHLQGIKISLVKLNKQVYHFIPFTMVHVATLLFVPATELTVLKWSMIVLQLLYMLHAFLIHRQNTSVQITIGILLSLVTILMLTQNWTIPIQTINILLIVVSFAVLAISIWQHKVSPSKLSKEIMEIHLFLFAGNFILGISTSYFISIIGILLIMIYQLTDILLTTKAFNQDLNDKMIRLNDLEYKFDRVVEYESKKRTSKMVDHVEQIKEKTQRDPLTKALNRQGTMDAIKYLIDDPGTKIFSIAFFDIDYFKTINDTKGHIVGDEVLKFISTTFMSRKRKTDQFGRYGGDEFILILPNVNAPMAIEICDRLRQEIDRTSSPKFTISMGVASFPFDGKTVPALIESADKGLYKAKENGKNRVEYAGSVPIIR